MDDDDSATTPPLLEAVQAGDVQRLRALAEIALAGVTSAARDQLSACLASALLTFDGAPGSAAMLRCLLCMGASPNARLSGAHVHAVSRHVPLTAGMHQLLPLPPIVIAACRMQPEAAELLMQHGAVVPPTVGDSAGALPLLAYWAHHLPEGEEHPAALPTLRLLLRGGADPLAFGGTPQYPDLSVRGRAGALAGFLLSCRSPLLLGVAVRHVLEQCREGTRLLAPPQVAQMCLAAHLAGPPLGHEAEQLLAQALLLGNCFPGAGYAAAPRARSTCPSPAGKERGPAPEPGPQRQCRASGAGASPSPLHGQVYECHMRVETCASDGEAGPSSRLGSPRAAALSLPPMDPGSAHHQRRDWMLSLHLHLRRQQAAGTRGGPADGEGPGERSEHAARAAWQRALREQLVADAAMHGVADLLAVLLGQGASPSEEVHWAYPPEALPPRGVPFDVPASLPSRSGQRPPLALAAAGGSRAAVEVLLRYGACPDAAALRHAVWSLNPAGVAALLSLWPGALPPSTPSSFATSALNCPVLLLLQRHLEASVVAAARAAAAAVPPGQPAMVVLCVAGLLAAAERRGAAQAAAAAPVSGELPLAGPQGGEAEQVTEHAPAATEQEQQRQREMAWAAAAFEALQPQLRRLEARAVRVMDLLVDAGRRINVYRDMCGRGPDGVWRMGRFVGLQPAELDSLQVEGRNRLLWEAYTRPAWSKASHPAFHPAFKAAAREFLLVARFGVDRRRQQLQACTAPAEEQQALGPTRRCSAGGGGPGRTGPSEAALAALGQLPEELVLQIVAAAAYPLSSWVRAE